ncbi:MAG: DUF952 domain-containing protein [Cyclobacteriaceae bacterium]|nr:DUF952 domain-containing protein [Cyclobacteriaceae bacterium]
MIYHITPKNYWEGQKNRSHYAPLEFEREGFIHCSKADQLKGVLQRYYSGQTDLLILEIDESKLDVKLLYEVGGTGELFPHVYGGISMNSILKVTPLSNFSLPQ